MKINIRHIVVLLISFLSFGGLSAETNIVSVKSHNDINPVQELSLEQAMNRAEGHSYKIKIAKSNVDITKQNKNAQILSMLPNISLQGTFQQPVDGFKSAAVSSVSPELGISTQGQVFTGAINLNQKGIGLYSLVLSLGQDAALMRSAVQTKNQTVQEERYYGAASYINAEKAAQLIKVADEAITVAQKQLDDAQAQFNEGLITNADVLKLKLNFDNARNTRVHAETTYQVALITLAEAIGEENETLIVLPSDYKSVMENKKTSLGNVNAIVNERLPLRYDILAYRENVNAQGYAKLNAIATYLPNLDFVMTFLHDFNATPLTVGNTVLPKKDVEDDMYYGLNFTWNFLDWGVRQTQINAASANEQIARLNLAQAHDNAKIDIVGSYNKLMDAYESLNYTKSSQEYAESIYKQRLDQFQNGLISSTDLIIAANDQTTAQANYVLAIGDLDLAWMAYYKATRQPLTTIHQEGLLQK